MIRSDESDVANRMLGLRRMRPTRLHFVGLTHEKSSRDIHYHARHNHRTPSSIRWYIRRRLLSLHSRCCSRLRTTWCDVAACSDREKFVKVRAEFDELDDQSSTVLGQCFNVGDQESVWRWYEGLCDDEKGVRLGRKNLERQRRTETALTR